jgi:integrase/recombinase XerD
MLKDTSGWERAIEMRTWRDHRGGLQPSDEPYLHTPLGLMVEEWLTSQRRRGLSRNTIQTRRLNLRRFTKWCSTQSVQGPEWMSRGLLDAWLDWLEKYRTKKQKPLTEYTKEGMIRSVNTFMQYLQERHIIDANPLEGHHIRRVRGRSMPSVMSETEVEALLSSPKTDDVLGLRDRAMLELLYSNGIRRSELAYLQLSHLRLQHHVLVVRHGKGAKDRIVPIGQAAFLWLNRYLTKARPQLLVPGIPCDYVFVTAYGDGFCAGYLGQIVRKYMSAIGLNMQGSCHLLRHACATHMLEHGADLRTIQTLLGHSRVDTTEIYTHVTTERMCSVHHRVHPRG